MAVKTFTDNTSLPASDINTYLNNGGLVYITQATATAAASLNVNNCFNSNFDNYRIVISNATADAPRALNMRLRASGTDSAASYYWGGYFVLFTGATAALNNGNNVGQFTVATLSTTPKSGTTFDVLNPFDAIHTTAMGTGSNFDAWFTFGGVHQVNASYDGFTIVPSAGTFTLTVRVYGYREA